MHAVGQFLLNVKGLCVVQPHTQTVPRAIQVTNTNTYHIHQCTNTGIMLDFNSQGITARTQSAHEVKLHDTGVSVRDSVVGCFSGHLTQSHYLAIWQVFS